jgi:chromate transport protein ChrA
MVGCMFSANLSSLGLFLPITAAIIIICNLIFGIIWFQKARQKKLKKSKPTDPTP